MSVHYLSSPDLLAGLSPAPSFVVLRREESNKLGRGGIWWRGAVGSESGLVAASPFRANARPRKPIVTKAAPAIISQCGKLIDENKSIIFSFTFGLGSTAERMVLEALRLVSLVHDRNWIVEVHDV